MSDVQQTTVPASTEPGGASERRLFAIRWLFPALDGRLSLLRPVSKTTIGRDATNDIELGGERTSRHHAEIAWVREVPHLQDLGSRNGVFVNGVRIERSLLSDGDLLRMGSAVGLVVTVSSDQFLPHWSFSELVAGYWVGPKVRALLEPLKKVAPTDLPVIVEGETGSGKEGVARALHHLSGRKGPFVALNCAALPESLAEAELFGYRRGAFTGAERTSPGHFRTAHGGTLFLDEVLELPLGVQAKLLRAIELRAVVPLGESGAVAVDTRFVVATQSPLGDAVQERRFRGDLHARLDGLVVQLPPLRARVEEVPFLFMTLLGREACGRPLPAVDPALVEALCLYDWPYNVRELDRVVRQLWAVHGDQPSLGRPHLPPRLQRGARLQEPTAGLERPAAEGQQLDQATVLAALREVRGNVRRAAQVLGISRQKVYRLLEDAGGAGLGILRGSSGPSERD